MVQWLYLQHLGQMGTPTHFLAGRMVRVMWLSMMSTLRIVYVKEHHASVQLAGVSDQTGYGPLVQVYCVLPIGGKEDILDLIWSDRNGFAVGVIG
jgi:hypothetical protein